MECNFLIPLMGEFMSCLVLSSPPSSSNNTAEITAMIDALSFLGPHGPVARDEHCVFITILSMLLVFAWARSRLVQMCNWRSRVLDP